MKRNDPHSPTNLVTEDYDFAYAYDAHPTEGDRRYAMDALNALLAEGWRFGQVHGGDTCDHCGTGLRYVAVLKHIPSHTLIKVGEQCLDNRFALASPEFHRLRTAATLNRERKAKADKRAEFLAVERNAEAVEFAREQADAAVEEFDRKHGYLPDPEFDDLGWGQFFVDVARKFDRYGDLSERQVEALLNSKARKAERDALRAAEQVKAAPCPAGKLVITGEVVKIDLHSNAYGAREVMIVRDDRGFKVWGTQPLHSPYLSASTTFISLSAVGRFAGVLATVPRRSLDELSIAYQAEAVKSLAGAYRTPLANAPLEMDPRIASPGAHSHPSAPTRPRRCRSGERGSQRSEPRPREGSWPPARGSCGPRLVEPLRLGLGRGVGPVEGNTAHPLPALLVLGVNDRESPTVALPGTR